MSKQPQTQANQPPPNNFLLFVALMLLLIVSWGSIKEAFWPSDPVKQAAGPDDVKKEEPGKGAFAKFKLPALPDPTRERDLLQMGDADPESAFNLAVKLDPRGGGLRSVTLNKFRESRDDGKPSTGLLDLVPAEANLAEASHLLYHFDTNKPSDDHPLDTLGKAVWEIVQTDGHNVVITRDAAGKAQHRVKFQAKAQGVVITKTYTLTEGDYHLGLQVKLSRPSTEKGTVRFRYQLTGAKGLPVEGKWYTSIFRNSLVGVEDDNGRIVTRDYQDLARVSWSGGGNSVERNQGAFIRYAAVAVQYFASVIAVDGKDDRVLRSARATLETGILHGRTRRGSAPAADRMSVLSPDGRTTESIFFPPSLRGQLADIPDKTPVAIRYRLLSYDPELKECPKLALGIRTGREAEGTHAMWEDDVTVRVNTEPVELAPGKSVVHSYTLYNGPVKPLLLSYLTGEKKVDPALVSHYIDDLKLNTMIDYQSSYFWYYTGWTWLVISVTNLIHWVLSHLYWVIPNLGLCIILLTVMVRGVMFPLSRKQALMAIKMQALAPEMKKLQEKYKDSADRQEMAMAQWALYKKHGVNPAGSCWVLLLQMPIFLGLYYALQESITFRLGPFPPTWISNLAAPDMLWHWGRHVPMISADSSYGGFIYLGPYFNILPIIAVVLMMVQQQMMTPPPTDEQQEIQQKVMKYMMIFFGLMFYKVAAGLCIYYIASTLWGFAERKLLPKAELDKFGNVGAIALPEKAAAPGAITAASSQGIVNSGKKKKKVKEKKDENQPKGFRERLSEWWNDVLDKAKKK